MAQLGEMHSASFGTDPKHLGFVLARYKFVAKMLAGKNHVLEVGCGDTTGARVVRPAVGQLIGVDVKQCEDPCIPIIVHDFLEDPLDDQFDAAYALDVLEHIQPAREIIFLSNLVASIKPGAPVIIGTPSKESQAYASDISRRYHVNCKTEDQLRKTLSEHFANVFLFGMNDETLHTGFGPMCQYRLAVCT